ncbi:MAG: DUF4427 domain-containing protein [Burkholderia gladioli]|uniref:DUF4427 domain-containing protein n=1 Tax=Paraburkholderia tropica TaxID=92647 RepID=UPI002ABD6E05|nr:DUF4427 domain-containing protein [Paraburkholderia tropica]
MKNSIRFDLSDYLIHFFRDVDLGGDSGIVFPEHMGWNNVFEDEQLPAYFLLRAALRTGRLWSTWSYRGGRRTVFGPDPAVCFTEMPVAAFLEAGKTRRANGEAMSPLAFAFPKGALQRLGARAAIYGLSADVALPNGDDGQERLLPDWALPSHEQYRYVTHFIEDSKVVDWMHEREWRWPYRSRSKGHQDPGRTISEWSDIPGLDFYLKKIEGIGVIVETRRQANLVLHDILMLIDRKLASHSTFGFVLVSDNLPSPNSIQGRVQLKNELEKSMVNLNRFYSLSHSQYTYYVDSFAKLVARVEATTAYETDRDYGGCWLWLHDNRADLTRALLQAGRVVVTKEGHYLASLHEFSDYRGLRQREMMTTQLAELVFRQFNVPCCFYSVSQSDNPEDAPSHAGQHDRDISFYNTAYREHA